MLSFGVLDQAASLGFRSESRGAVGPTRVQDADPDLEEWYLVTHAYDERRDGDRFSALLETDHPDGVTARIDVELIDRGTGYPHHRL